MLQRIRLRDTSSLARLSFAAGLGVLLSSVALTPAHAYEIRIIASADGYAIDDEPDGVFESLNVSGDNIVMYNYFNLIERGIVEFDISSIPPTANVLSAHFEMRISGIGGISGHQPDIVLHGYEGNGVVDLADATVSSNLIGSYVDIPSTETVVLLDETYVQSLLGIADYLGLSISTDYGGSISFRSIDAYPVWEPQPTLVLEIENVLYVDGDAPPGGDGLTWATAYDNLQAALDAAIPGTDIWVAAGTYRPTQRTDPGNQRTVTFQLQSGVSLFGGFAGNETERSERDILANLTILSGDILGDDSGPSAYDDNAYHVVTGSGTDATAVLDGFRVERGRAEDAPTSGDRFGGGIRNIAGSPTIRSTVFYLNAADSGGGNMYNEGGSAPTVVQCAFVRGFSYGKGAAIYNVDSDPAIVNSVIYDNYGYTGSGVWSESGSVPSVVNSIFWENGHDSTESEQIETVGASALISHCCIMGWTGALGGTGNFGADPAFADPLDLDFRLRARSPCLDAGDSLALPADFDDLDGDGDTAELLPVDAGGNDRVTDALCGADTGVPTAGSSSIVDLGMYELDAPGPPPPARVHVRSGADGAGDGSDWANAYPELREALLGIVDYACVVDEIWVAEGVYTPTAGTDRSATFVLVDGVAMYGGFSGWETELSERNPDPQTNNTVLSGDIGTPGVFEDNSQSVVTVSYTIAATVIDGFTIRDGNADWGASYSPEVGGGGMYGRYAGATVRRCVFEGNRGRLGAAAFAYYDGRQLFEDCVFRNNRAIGANDSIGDGGVGFFYRDATVAFRRCSFFDNHAPDGAGGAVRVTAGGLEAVDCAFTGNSASAGGAFLADGGTDAVFMNCTFDNNRAEMTAVATTALGGVGYLLGGNPRMVNCRMSHNSSEVLGGALLVVLTDDARLTNCTINSNGAEQLGGGADVVYDSVLTVENSIFWGNTDSNGLNGGQSAQIRDDPRYGENTIEVAYSCVKDAVAGDGSVYPGGGNTDLDPLFVDPLASNMRLQSASPCIDTGSTGLLPADSLDLDGDMDTSGPIPLDLAGMPRVFGLAVDMGAYEWFGSLSGDLDGDGDVDLNDYTLMSACLTGPLPPRPGDADGDGDVDVSDYAFWVACLGGPGIPSAGGCQHADFDGDVDVDAADFAYLQRVFTGSVSPLPPECVSADFDLDGDVDLVDFAAFSHVLANGWGKLYSGVALRTETPSNTSFGRTLRSNGKRFGTCSYLYRIASQPVEDAGFGVFRSTGEERP